MSRFPQYNNYTEWWDVTDTNYGLDQLFPQLLKDSPYVTTNPEEADYFYIDVWTFYPAQNLSHIVRDVKSLGPWWDKKGGADHIFVVTCDQGRCEPDKFGEDASRAIMLQHWGGSLLHLRAQECNLEKRWGGECDHQLMLLEHLSTRKRPDVVQQCFRQGHDIVVPPTPFERHDSVYDYPYRKEKKATKYRTPPSPYINETFRQLYLDHKTTWVYYSGPVDLYDDEPWSHYPPWVDGGYSFGSRQYIKRLFTDKPGFVLEEWESNTSYWQALTQSTFCVAPLGWGWGARFKVAVTRGCIPIVLGDGVHMEFEEQLPLRDYSLRFPLWTVHKLDKLLDWVKDHGRIKEMQENLECTWRLHWWRRPHGRAFDVVMCELKRRLLGKPRIEFNTRECRMECGDGRWIDVRAGYNQV